MNFRDVDSAPWITLAATDASQLEVGPVRHFLWSVADKESPRSDFESFVRVYDHLEGASSFSTVLEAIAKFFPRPTDGRKLKSAILSDQRIVFSPRFESKDILSALSTTDRYESFNSDELSLKERAAHLLSENPAAGSFLLQELFRASLNPIGEEILEALIVAMRPADALQCERQHGAGREAAHPHAGGEERDTRRDCHHHRRHWMRHSA
jgi:hypothetical protein